MYVNLKPYLGQKINVKVIKTAHRRSSFLKKLVSQEIIVSIGLRKNLLRNFQNYGQAKC